MDTNPFFHETTSLSICLNITSIIQTKRYFDKNHIYMHTNKNLTNINSYDIETYEKNSYYLPFCVCYIVKEQSKYFYGNKVVVRSILSIFLQISQSENIIIYVHNLDFDGFLILEEISRYRKIKIEFLIHKMKIYYLRLSFNKRQIEFRCSKKILPASLSSIANDFKLDPKLPYPYQFINEHNLYYVGKINYVNFPFSYVNIQKYTIKYCMRDVEITKKFITHIRAILKKDQKLIYYPLILFQQYP